jgi:hypothetical protein
LIRTLFDQLFQPDKTIYIWGEIDELLKFTSYQLFTSNQIYLSRNINLQMKFKQYWNDNYPHQRTSSSNGPSTCKCKTCFGILHDNSLALQDAVAFELNRWMDKRLTCQPFDIGLDPHLQRLNDKQIEYRRSLCVYAANDCDAILQLIISTNIINEQGENHVISSTNLPLPSPNPPTTTTNYELELISDDDLQPSNQEPPSPLIKPSINKQHKKLSDDERRRIRNRKCTLKQRERYYKTEIILEDIDKRFTIREIKNILRQKNISFFAVNISNSSINHQRTLYIGIRNKSKLSTYKIQTQGLFTRNHYREYRRQQTTTTSHHHRRSNHRHNNDKK